MRVYYNEIDGYACSWISNLMDAGHIAPGRIDDRSIVDVSPDDLRGYARAHFFAGIAGWELAARLAGWPDDRELWTGSCPCQPFSSAGQQAGFDDERHLWPQFFRLIRECRPATIVGEQVASKAVDPWIDLVLADLEGVDYAGGAVAFPSAGIGAPHIRDRTYWVGHANDARLEGHPGHGGAARREGPQRPAAAAGVLGGVANAGGVGREVALLDTGSRGSAQGQREAGEPGVRDALCGLADAGGSGRDQARQRVRATRGDGPLGGHGLLEGQPAAGAVNGMWGVADWLFCRDGKWRPVESGTFPLASRVSSRVGRLRAYGNAINAEQGAEFLRAVMDCAP